MAFYRNRGTLYLSNDHGVISETLLLYYIWPCSNSEINRTDYLRIVLLCLRTSTHENYSVHLSSKTGILVGKLKIYITPNVRLYKMKNVYNSFQSFIFDRKQVLTVAKILTSMMLPEAS